MTQVYQGILVGGGGVNVTWQLGDHSCGGGEFAERRGSLSRYSADPGIMRGVL